METQFKDIFKPLKALNLLSLESRVDITFSVLVELNFCGKLYENI